MPLLLHHPHHPRFSRTPSSTTKITNLSENPRGNRRRCISIIEIRFEAERFRCVLALKSYNCSTCAFLFTWNETLHYVPFRVALMKKKDVIISAKKVKTSRFIFSVESGFTLLSNPTKTDKIKLTRLPYSSERSCVHGLIELGASLIITLARST